MISTIRKVVWGVLMLVLATGPATVLCTWCVAAIMFAPVSLLESDWLAAVGGLLWGIAGVAGTMALWTVTISSWSRWVPIGLAVGLIAWLPLPMIFLPIDDFFCISCWTFDDRFVAGVLTLFTLPLIPVVLIVADYRYRRASKAHAGR